MNSHSNPNIHNPNTVIQYVPWTHDASDPDVQWWTRDDHEVGVMRSRGDDGEWGKYTVAYVDDGSPAGDAHYQYYAALDDAKEAACMVENEEIAVLFDVLFGSVAPTSTNIEGGVDVDVTVSANGLLAKGVVTLIQQDGTWQSLGDPEIWVSENILYLLRHLTCEQYTETLRRIAQEAADAISSSGIGHD